MNKILCVLENPQNLANIGGVIRNVEALGLEQMVIISPKYREWPQDIGRSSMNQHCSTIMQTSAGAARWVRVIHFETIAECIRYLQEQGYASLGTSSHSAVPLKQFDKGNKKWAVWFGREQSGLSDEALQHVEKCVKIEMSGKCESLNLNVATGIVLYSLRS